MDEQQQILYMQARLIRMASEKWNMSIGNAARLFDQYRVLNYIDDCYEIFHVQGDMENLEDIECYMKRRAGTAL